MMEEVPESLNLDIKKSDLQIVGISTTSLHHRRRHACKELLIGIGLSTAQ
jgi:hypothetical protein